MKKVFKKVLGYLKYPSTIKGIIAALAIVGVKLAPEQSDAIITAAGSVIAAIWTFMSDSDVA